jgi:hypothetical protein
MLIIGSKALQHHGVLPSGRVPSDTDIIGTFKEYQKFAREGKWKVNVPLSGNKFKLVDKDNHINEFTIAWDGSTDKELLDLMEVGEFATKYATPHIVLLLKETHKYLKNSPHFNKTMEDIIYLRETLNCTVNDYIKTFDGWHNNNALRKWYDRREKETYNYSLPKLNQGKKDFFNDDTLEYIFDHDLTHEVVALGDRPAYLEYKPEDVEVWCDKGMFFECDELTKLKGVYEESLVLTLERWLVPNDFKVNPYDGFKIALMKVCTSITSGWFREYAWENYHRVLQMYSNDFVDQFKVALSSGEIKPFKGSVY